MASLLSLSGCGMQEAIPPTGTPIPTAVPTSTPSVGFAVVVTQVPTARPTGTPVPTATPFAVPPGPYIELIPSTGAPVSRRILVRGGHLPPSVGVQLGWSSDGKSAPIATGAGTDKKGMLLTHFSVPASPPGRYYVLLTIGGVRYASAPYVVSSAAALSARAIGRAGSNRIIVRGTGFLPHLKVLLIAYPIDVKGRPLVVGTTRSGRYGRFKYVRSFARLALGQYLLRAWSDNALAAQMAETYFQVVI